MIAVIFLVVVIAACSAPLICLILRDENKEARLRDWEAESIVRKLQGESMYLRPGYTNSVGPH